MADAAERVALLAEDDTPQGTSDRGKVQVVDAADMADAADERGESAPAQSAPERPGVTAPTAPCTFRWNNRECTGNSLHLAALNGSASTLEELLDADPQLISSRFTYETRFQDHMQEGSGEAIHIAASRGAVDAVQCLLQRKAQLDAAVTRDHKKHYDVLHAAVFAEGKGGTERMLRMLLDAGAAMKCNGDKRSALHLAFQTGKVELITTLRAEMAVQGVLEEAEDISGDVPSPLMMGIELRKLSEEQLSQVAGLTPQSLLTFIHHEPACIPMFLDRWGQEGGMRAEDLAELVKVRDLSKVILESVEAANALLNAVTELPATQSEGWHPLPTRLSFAPRTRWEKMQSLLNPATEFKSFYVPDKDWAFDSTTHKPPAWHTELTDLALGRPVRDVRIGVCKVPNIVSAEFLVALCSCATDDDRLFIFKNVTIRCLLNQVWWHGAIRIDILEFTFSTVALLLLIAETGLVGLRKEKEWVGLADSFICARACVDILHESLQFAGYVKIGQPRAYLDWGNMYDGFRCVVPVFLFSFRDLAPLRVTVILLAWFRLLELNFSESMRRELLPLTRLVTCLVPALFVACIGFFALTHAFYELGVLDGPDHGSTALLDCFAMLITGAIPDQEDHHLSGLRLVLTYASVLIFTVFFLNIFISVIGENYSIQKTLSPLVFQAVRSNICCTYLLRASVLPGWIHSIPCVAGIATLMAVAILLLLLTVILRVAPSHPLLTLLFALFQLTLMVVSYHNPSMALAHGRPSAAPRENHYLWCVEAMQPEPVSQIDKVHHQLDQVRMLLDRHSKQTRSRSRLDGVMLSPANH
uniref:Ion transport domain-containing protein n=1 Tax=Pyrodinium bahamense TaxID=73915 RepID=A0A7R9ZVJ9_9DINO